MQPQSSSTKESLWANFGLIFRVGLVAAGRDVEIVDGDRSPAIIDRRGDVARVFLAAEAPPVHRAKRPSRDDGDAVIALLAVDLDVAVPGLAEGLEGKIGVRALGFLEAEDIGTLFPKQALHQADPQPDRVDVPGGDGKRHLRNRQGRKPIGGGASASPA